MTHAHALPPDAYTSTERLAAERQLFLDGWLCVGRETDYPDPGSYRSFDFAGQPVLVWRGADGKLRAFENVCRHRMSTIAEGEGCATRLACPFHGWTYAHSGELCAVPLAAQHRGQYHLPELAVDTWLGFVFACARPDAKPLGPQLAGVAEILAPYSIDDFAFSIQGGAGRVAANWKLIMEIGLESYHFPFVHRDSLAPNLTGRAAPPPGNGAWTVSVEPRTRVLAAELAPDLDDAERGITYTFGVFPGTVFNVDVDNLVWFSVVPVDTTTSNSWFGAAARSEDHLRALGTDAPVPIDDYLDWADQLGREDNAACERVQRGITGRFAAPGPLVIERENALTELHAYLNTHLEGMQK